MTWVKLDDAFPESTKVDPLTDGAFRLHVAALCHASRLLTDGYIGADRVARLVPRYRKQQVTELVNAGLWHPVKGGWSIHDYLDYNPTAESVRAEREAAAERMRQARSKKARSGERSGEQTANKGRTFGDCSASPSSSPSLGLHESSSSTNEGGDRTDDDDQVDRNPNLRAEAALRRMSAQALQARKHPTVVAKSGPVGNDDRWLGHDLKAQRAKHETRLTRLALEHPEATTEQLIALLDAPPKRTPCPHCEGKGGRFDEHDDGSVTRTPCPTCGGTGTVAA